MFLLDLLFGDEGRVGVVEISCAFLEGFLLGDSNAEKWSDHQKKKLFINKSVEALIPLKEGYQGLLKQGLPWGVFQQGQKNGNFQKGNFV